jgi:hypothetical protein
MSSSPRVARLLISASLVLGFAAYPAAPRAIAQTVSSVKRVQVLGNRAPAEIEIELAGPALTTGTRLAPQAQVLSNPDRLVVDFPNAVPAAELRNQSLKRDDVKSVRVALYSAKPPVTRVVFDLNGPQPYQIFPSGRTVLIKLGTATAQPAVFNSSASTAKLVNTNYPVQSYKITPPPPLPLVVIFQNGKLTVRSNKATLSEVLFAIHQRTGAQIAIPAGAEQEQVVAELGPAPAPEVLSSLLNGSRFNFLILSSASDPTVLDRVILSARPDAPNPALNPLPQMPPVQPVDEAEQERNQPPPTNPDPANPEGRTTENAPD